MRVLVLAAGFATRLHPLTESQAKPLLDVGGRPVLSRLLDRVLAIPAIGEVVVVTNGKFQQAFETWRREYDSPVAVRLISDGAMHDGEKLGALGDAALALASMDATGGIFLVAGDNLIDFDLRPCAAEFRARETPLLMVRRIEGTLPPRRYGEVEVAEDGRVLRFREKPDDPRSCWSAICAYFLPAEIRGLLPAYLDTGGNADAPGYFLEWLVARREVRALPIAGPFWDIGNLETLQAARRAFA